MSFKRLVSVGGWFFFAVATIICIWIMILHVRDYDNTKAFYAVCKDTNLSAPLKINEEGVLVKYCGSILFYPGENWKVVRDDGHTVEFRYEVFLPGADRPDLFRYNLIVHIYEQSGDPDSEAAETSVGFDPDYEEFEQNYDGVYFQFDSQTEQAMIIYDQEHWVPELVSTLE